MTTHSAIEQVAFDLFEREGFDATTMDDIATAVGVSRRTLFRYYPSKNDILWGQFDDSLRALAATLAAFPDDLPVADAIRERSSRSTPSMRKPCPSTAGGCACCSTRRRSWHTPS